MGRSPASGDKFNSQAQQRVVQMILPENFDDAVPECEFGIPPSLPSR